jgi:8-oxo-dGTP pyrophosphatase MutT (NUDIX family)
VLVDPDVALEPPPRPWRLSSRLLVVDAQQQVLLIRAFDPHDARVGEWWEVPGGGVEPGEDAVSAAVRETAEETGYLVPAECVGGECWRGETTYTWLSRRHWAEIVLHVARVSDPLARRGTDWAVGAQSSFLEVCWVPVAEVVGREGRYFPRSLAADLPRLLAGERIDAGFTVWS